METPPTNSDHHLLRDPPPHPAAQSPAPSSNSVPMLLPVFIAFFILMCFLSVFLFRDLLYYLSTTWHRSRGRAGGATGDVVHRQGEEYSGLDPAILASFPTLPYEAVRGIQEGKCGGECAVCLGEFAGGDVIRLLTVCCHAFHPACIDSWLQSHTTCPMCRSDLEAPPDEAAVMALRDAVGGGEGESCSILVEEGEGEAGRMAKSQSWDHSIVAIGRMSEEEEETGYRIRSIGSAEERTDAYRSSTGSR